MGVSELVNLSPVATADGSMLVGSQHTSVVLLDARTGQLLRCAPRPDAAGTLARAACPCRWSCLPCTLISAGLTCAVLPVERAGPCTTLMASWDSWTLLPSVRWLAGAAENAVVRRHAARGGSHYAARPACTCVHACLRFAAETPFVLLLGRQAPRRGWSWT